MSDIVLPLDFRLHDANEEPVLHLDGARRLTLAIRNTSTKLFLDPQNQAHHFALRFRAGVLVEHQKISVGGANRNDWEVGTKEEHGEVLVHLRHKTLTGMEWASLTTLEIVLEGFRASGDSRATRVELDYQHIRSVGQNGKVLPAKPRHHRLVLTALPESRRLLGVHFVGPTGHVVLNDGRHENTIVMKLTTSKPLVIRPDSSFFLRLAAGDDEETGGALGTRGQLERIKLKAALGGALSLTAVQRKEPHAVEWEIKAPTNMRPNPRLEPSGFLELELSPIVTRHINGPSIVRVRWEDLGKPDQPDEDYPDGIVVATLQKSPLVIVGERVGIGTIPGRGLELDSETMTEANAEAERAMREFVRKSTWKNGSPISFVIGEFPPPCGKWPCIRWNRVDSVLWFAMHWPGVGGDVKVKYVYDQGLEMGQFVRGPSAELQQKLRTLYDWWEGREQYVLDLVARATPGSWEPRTQFSPSINNQALEDLFLNVFRIPLKPNKSLYARLDSPQGRFANMQQFGLFFADDLGWFCPDAVFLARWDEAGVRLCDGTLHPCALPKSSGS